MRFTTLISFIICCLTYTPLYAQAADFVISEGQTVTIRMPKGQKPVASTALEMLRNDVKRVLGSDLVDTSSKGGVSSGADQKAGKNVRGKASIVCSIDKSLPAEGFKHQVKRGVLHITGADSHGLAYGLLELSRLLGVSPWEYWADCTPRHRESFTLAEGYEDEQSPSVRYRGIFINDEDWGLNPWATKQEPEAWTIKSGRIKGAIGPKVNEKVFQLLLRLRANYYWPAMHECSQPFFTIEGNREMAKKYGIYVGGSHCEPMATSPAAEWAISGEGEYNYVTNSENVKRFWQKRLDDVKDQEVVYTLGMRGVHDGAMQGVKTMDEKVKYLQLVIDDQRKMLLSSRKNKKGTAKTGRKEAIPQVFVPYKEVLDIYKNGLSVPDDVTLMWTDDNYGYIRHFPDSTENARSGGNGIYYHCSYWGRPHDYLWLNSMPLDLMKHQLQTAYDKGIRQIWVLNVGDIKPSELQTELFMQMAWRYGYLQRINKDSKHRGGADTSHKEVAKTTKKVSPQSFLNYFCNREFGSELASATEDVLNTYFRLTSDCKPEFMAGTRVEESDKAYWNKVRPMPGDWDKRKVALRVRDYEDISRRVDSLFALVPADRKDAFFELVKYPVQAAAQMSFKYLCPERCEEAYDSIQTLTRIYNKICAGGKWDGIMDASPRNLAVFQKVTSDMLPEYPERSEWEPIMDIEKPRLGAEPVYSFDVAEGTDSVTIQVRLMPTHPVDGEHLTFSICIDNGSWVTRNYETYDRSEEWKQNVLRGYAERTVTVPVDKRKTHHTIRFTALSPGGEKMPQSLYIRR